MRILHYSLGFPPFRTGGMTNYCMDLMKSQSEENEVFLLWPGNFTILKKTRIKIRNNKKRIISCEIINPKYIPICNGIKNISPYMEQYPTYLFRNLFRIIHPDIVHIHTLMGLDKTFFDECKRNNIKVVFTTHDYFGICPTAHLFDGSKICDGKGKDLDKCYNCSKNAYSKKRIELMQSKFYALLKNTFLMSRLRKKHRNMNLQFEQLKSEQIGRSEYDKLQKYYFDLLSNVSLMLCNSSVSFEVYDEFFPSIPKIITPISRLDITDRRKERTKIFDKNSVKFLFLGPIGKAKGAYLLLETLEQIYKKHKNFNLIIYSRDELPKQYDFVVKYNEYSLNDLSSICNSADILVFPSIWKETFGYTVLESYSFGLPCLVSNYAGAKDIIVTGQNGILYDGSQDDLKKNLLNILTNPNLLYNLNVNIKRLPWNVKYNDLLSIYNGVMQYE